MKICKDTKEPKAKPIPGHLYMHIDPGNGCDGNIFICTEDNFLIDLDDGKVWSIEGGFGVSQYSSPKYWKDVTDEYCLQRIE